MQHPYYALEKLDVNLEWRGDSNSTERETAVTTTNRDTRPRPPPVVSARGNDKTEDENDTHTVAISAMTACSMKNLSPPTPMVFFFFIS